MQIYEEKDRISVFKKDIKIKNSAVALGCFDAIHMGHREIISKMVELSKEKSLTSCVYMFKNQPRQVLEGVEVLNVNSYERRLEILEELGVDIVIAEWFLPEHTKISPEEFIKSQLKDKLDAKVVVAGYNYRFGMGGNGDMEYMQKSGKDLGIDVVCMPCVEVGGKAVSSTRIRECIQRGEIEEANSCLGEKFSVSGKVVFGNQIGREMNFPTANMELLKDMVMPKCGVYITKTKIENKAYTSITNVGEKPTVEVGNPCIETHIMGYAGDLYNKEIDVSFYKYMRDIVKFPNLEGLKKQLAFDKEIALNYFK